jgi:outer membrane protein OmpA-like peptidoglycan-associated protein
MRIFFIALVFLAGCLVSLQAQPGKERSKKRFNGNIRIYNTTNINTGEIEFSPAYYLNGLVYVSQYKSGPIDLKTGQTFFELFYAELDPNGMPLKPQAFSVEINSPLHEGPVCFNERGDKMYFTRSNQEKGMSRADAQGRVRLKIYEAQKGFFDWENVKELPFNSNDYSCLHPSMSADESKLFFASDMPGGYGGMDLYFAEKRGDSWSKPINLGPEINTTGNEVFPFIHESGSLFFASNGHKGMGGLDLFMIDIGKPKWGRVINLGEPFNSPQDDLGIILNEDGDIGYFASDREGGFGKDDIYLFEAPDGIEGLELPDLQTTVIAVYDAGSAKRIPGADIRIFERSSDGLINNEQLYNLELLPAAVGSEDLVMKLVRKKDEELGEPKLITNRNGEAVTQFEPNRSYIIIVSKPGFTTQEVFFSTAAETPSKPIEVLLQPSNCLALAGVVLTEQFNRPIPNAVVRVINECDGTQDAVRTNLDGKFEYCIQIGCDFTVVAEKDGFDPATSHISTVKIRGRRSVEVELRLRPNSNTVLREPIRKGTRIILENIYYDFNKSAIRTGEARDLEALARLMKMYPSMEIELGAHTDSRGTESYNLQLSLRRAESAKDFLVRKGVAALRIKAFGYGEAFPRNRCSEGVDCSEEEHQYNRRTEVKVTKIDEPLEIGYSKDGIEIIEKNN